MNDQQILVTGMVLSAMPIGEYDKRVTILSRERGKLSAFARGARRPASAMLASTEPFAFGEFTLFEGKSSYNIIKTDISNYFREISMEPAAAWLGFYFLELADYFSFENLDGSEELALLFFSLKALLHERFDNALVRRVFELKTLVISGEYPDAGKYALSQSASYTFSYIAKTPVNRLYRFAVTPEVLTELSGVIDDYFRVAVDHRFRSLAVLEGL